jgi:hypothetical protein
MHAIVRTDSAEIHQVDVPFSKCLGYSDKGKGGFATAITTSVMKMQE